MRDENPQHAGSQIERALADDQRGWLRGPGNARGPRQLGSRRWVASGSGAPARAREMPSVRGARSRPGAARRRTGVCAVARVGEVLLAESSRGSRCRATRRGRSGRAIARDEAVPEFRDEWMASHEPWREVSGLWTRWARLPVGASRGGASVRVGRAEGGTCPAMPRTRKSFGREGDESVSSAIRAVRGGRALPGRRRGCEDRGAPRFRALKFALEEREGAASRGRILAASRRPRGSRAVDERVLHRGQVAAVGAERRRGVIGAGALERGEGTSGIRTGRKLRAGEDLEPARPLGRGNGKDMNRRPRGRGTVTAAGRIYAGAHRLMPGRVEAGARTRRGCRVARGPASASRHDIARWASSPVSSTSELGEADSGDRDGAWRARRPRFGGVATAATIVIARPAGHGRARARCGELGQACAAQRGRATRSAPRESLERARAVGCAAATSIQRSRREPRAAGRHPGRRGIELAARRLGPPARVHRSPAALGGARRARRRHTAPRSGRQIVAPAISRQSADRRCGARHGIGAQRAQLAASARPNRRPGSAAAARRGVHNARRRREPDMRRRYSQTSAPQSVVSASSTRSPTAPRARFAVGSKARGLQARATTNGPAPPHRCDAKTSASIVGRARPRRTAGGGGGEPRVRSPGDRAATTNRRTGGDGRARGLPIAAPIARAVHPASNSAVSSTRSRTKTAARRSAASMSRRRHHGELDFQAPRNRTRSAAQMLGACTPEVPSAAAPRVWVSSRRTASPRRGPVAGPPRRRARGEVGDRRGRGTGR